MANLFDSTLLPSDNTVEENRKAILDLLKKINSLAASVGEDVSAINVAPVPPLTAKVGANTMYTLPIKTAGTQTILIPEAYLVASAAGPFTLTITTGDGDTVKVPIAAFGDTITSGDLLFDIYVDASGNVTSKDWEISGGNANGYYSVKLDGSLSNRFLDSTVRTTGSATGAIFKTNDFTQTFAYPFVNTTGLIADPIWVTDPTSPGSAWGGSGAGGLTATTASLCGFSGGNNRTGYVGHSAVGRWRT